MLKAGYICHKCGLDVTDVQVREREETEDIENYVHHIARMCGENHKIQSPYCHAIQFDLKIPMTDKGIGFAGRQLTDEEMKEVSEYLKKPKSEL